MHGSQALKHGWVRVLEHEKDSNGRKTPLSSQRCHGTCHWIPPFLPSAPRITVFVNIMS